MKNIEAQPAASLWSLNTPANFWLCQEAVSSEEWQQAIVRALPALNIPEAPPNIDLILALTLGEGRFGASHWQLGMIKKLYYRLKPLIPRPIARELRKIYKSDAGSAQQNFFPVDERYCAFLWGVLREILLITGRNSMVIKNFWRGQNQFAFVLTHDVETGLGQGFVTAVADLEQSMGFRSSFNFVPERYSLNFTLMENLRQRGFEIGVHGLHHDGRLFDSQAQFARRAARINQYLKQWSAVGFRAPLTHRQPEWMQTLNIDYDLSFFDTDPYEPIPGGAMSVWPFFLGHFIELPYTLAQDYTLTAILAEKTPQLWLNKIQFLKKYHGLALVNSHPDYLKDPAAFKIYADFLAAMKSETNYWHALPRDVAQWWRQRAQISELCKVSLCGAELKFESLDA